MRHPLSQQLLDKYADVLIRFALGSGQGIKRNEVVFCLVPDVAKPFYGSLQGAILRSGGQPMMRLLATGYNRQFYELANHDQLTFFPERYFKARVNLIDHYVGIIAEDDPFELQGIEPKKIIASLEAKKKLRDWQNDKEYKGKFTWTTALWGTPAMAKAAGLTETAYWEQIIKACFLDFPNPIKKWQEVLIEQNRVREKLNKMAIDQVHIQAKNTDLWLKLGQKRQWVGGNGRNIPSFEIFTSPDWRGTRGYIAFNQPLYRYGNRIEGIRLQFSKGKIVAATAVKGEKLLKAMIERPNADKVGEFSLTDARLSRITKFMANTLFDENMGGNFGNTHIAIGMSYKDAFFGDPRKLNKKLARTLGFNDSGEHTDMISTEDRQVTALLQDESEVIIYQDGKFIV